MKKHRYEDETSPEDILLLHSLLDMARSLHDHNRYEEALCFYEEILKIDIRYFEAYFHLGNALYELGRYAEALGNYDQAIALRPDVGEIYAHRAATLKMLHRFEEAVQSYNQAIAFNPKNPVLYSNRGNLLHSLQRYEEALESYDNALSLNLNYADAYSNRGITLYALKRYKEALYSYDKAMVIDPNHADAYVNRAAGLIMLRRYEEAFESYRHAIKRHPRSAKAYSHRGNLLKTLHRYEEASEDYHHAIAINPQYAGAYRNKALLSLLLGDLKVGFELYEWRWKRDDSSSFARTFAQPSWLGKENIKDKTILIYTEQGLGDAIQFCRYVSLVAQLGAKIVLEVTKPLHRLFRQLKGVERYILNGEPLPYFDYHCPLMSLPLAFGTTLENIPCSMPYLTADDQKVAYWQEKYKHLADPKIGLVWSGSPLHNNDHNRSIALQTLVTYLPKNLTYVSLQKEIREDDRAVLQKTPYLHFIGDELDDFTDTAGLCECMDLVISVDTSVAHLACAMNKKTILLLPFAPDWRWMTDRNDSPWYPSVRLMRQTHINDWTLCLSRLKAFLEHRYC